MVMPFATWIELQTITNLDRPKHTTQTPRLFNIAARRSGWPFQQKTKWLRPDANTRKPGIRSGQKYKSELKKGEARSGPTSAAVARPLTSPLPDPFSADRGGRNRDTGTCAVRCRREAAQGSKRPRSRGKSVVRLAHGTIFAPVPKFVN
jgi:hypothetical protein